MLVPGCEATMVQVPTDTRVKAASVTVHTAGVLELNCTAWPEVAEAESAAGVVPNVWVGGALNVMVCAPTTKKDADCVEAGAKMVLPGCEAITMQVPGAMRVRVLPDTVQAEELIDSNCTVKPEVAVAVSEVVVPAV